MSQYARAKTMLERLTDYYKGQELQWSLTEHGGQGLYVWCRKEGDAVGLLLRPDELDNGAAGFRDNALRKIAAYREGVAFVPEQPKGRVYDDVMTVDNLED